MSKIKTALPTVLTIAGSDPSGGAGIQTDIKTIHALGSYALSVPTVMTSQNTQGVTDTYCLPEKVVKSQLEALSADIQIDAIKIGMLGNEEIINTVSAWLKSQPKIPVILDPIIQSSSGRLLLTEQAINTLKTKLIPQVSLVTPNLPELDLLLGLHIDEFATERETVKIKLTENKWPSTLIKGGHSQGKLAVDYLMEGDRTHEYSSQRIKAQHNHGTGCTLSSAIATQVASGKSFSEAVGLAKDYLTQALSTADSAQPNYLELPNKTNRHGGLNHFHAIKR